MGRMDRVKIGTVTLAEPVRVTQHYETAAWYTDYEVAPGTYEVHAYVYGRFGNDLWLWQPGWNAPGTVVDEFFSNRLFGAYTPDPNNGKNVGKVVEHTPMPLGAAIDLLPGFRAEHGYVKKAVAS